jgi:hypothetical protein
MPQNELPAVAVLQQVKIAFMFVWLFISPEASGLGKNQTCQTIKKTFQIKSFINFCWQKSINHEKIKIIPNTYIK